MNDPAPTAWKPALLELVDLLTAAQAEYLLIGGTAAHLQGLARVPKDLDFRFPSAHAVRRAAAGFAPFTADGERVVAGCAPPDGWTSTREQPTVDFDVWGSRWTYGCWSVHGIDVEAVHIEVDGAGDALAEVFGDAIWAHVRWLPFEGRRVPVGPLEVQYVASLYRGRRDRAREYAELLHRRGFDPGLVEHAARARGVDAEAALAVLETARRTVDER